MPMFVSWKPSPVLAFLDEHWSDFYLQVPISVSTFCFSGPLLVGFPKVPFLDLLFSSTGNLTDLKSSSADEEDGPYLSILICNSSTAVHNSFLTSRPFSSTDSASRVND